MTTSEQLFEQSQNADSRWALTRRCGRFGRWVGHPFLSSRPKVPISIDEDGRQYIELINSWGPMILGHAFEPVEKAVRDAIQHSFSFGAPTRKEVEMAELITTMVPSVEKVRMVNSGTEATMAAIRVARGFTGRDKTHQV